jgi:hypothetical protein
VVDTIGQFAGLTGSSENDAGAALAAVQPLQVAAAHGIAVVIVQHERKSGGDPADAARGSSAIGGAVDIIVSVRRPEGKSKPTVRLLQSVSRYDQTPAELVVELTADGYVALGEPGDLAERQAREAILSAARSAWGEYEAAEEERLWPSTVRLPGKLGL